jgi:glycosyltransferase involved in cell wall biosynthesis
MKVLIFSHEFPPQVGGAGIVGQQFTQVLKEKHEVYLLTRKRNKPQNESNLKIINILPDIKIPGIWFLTSFLKLIFFNFRKFDRIVLNDFPSSVVASFLFRKSTLSRSIFLWHGSEDKTILAKNSINGKLFRKKYIRALKQSKRILAVSEFQKEKMLKDSELESLRKKTIIQYAGIDDRLFFMYDSLKRKSIRKQFNISDDDIILLSVGRINKLKGYKEMFNIVKKLPANFKWLIIGDGDLNDWLRNEIMKNHITNISLIGRVERKKINEFYNLADLFFLFSSAQLQEAFGLVYIEAALTGLPSLARKKEYDGTNEAVKDVGWLMPDEKTVIEFLRSKVFLNSNRKSTRERALKFSLSNLKTSIENNICS